MIPDLFTSLRDKALGQLLASPRHRRVRLVRQLSATDCGPAALAMVLGFWGKSVGLVVVRYTLNAGRDVVSAAAILHAARWQGLRGRGVRLGLCYILC